MKNKKLLFLAGAAALLLAGCTPSQSSSEPTSSEPEQSSSQASSESSQAPVVEKHYFGAGGYATYDPAPRGADVQAEINYAAILTDEAGKIEKLRIDTVQVSMKLVEGVYTLTNKDATAGGDVKSKWELLAGYNMLGSSAIEKEWYQQAEAFENFAVGKTIVELKAQVNEDSELVDGVTAGVTITVNHFVSAIDVALENKVLVEGEVAAIAVGGVNAKSMQAPAYTAVKGYDYTIAGAAFTADKKVLAARVDTFQIELKTVEVTVGEDTVNKAQINEEKKQVVADERRIKGKQELKDLYGMTVASPIGKEWYLQAAALVDHLVGKTVGAALGTEDELSNGAEVGVTITISGYRDALLEAEKTAFTSRY